jgi:hypothetical protein
MAATGSVRIVKSFMYRGAIRNFSNRYAIGVNVPPDDAHWTTLCDNITAAEKLIFNAPGVGGATILEAVGYAPGSEVPVFSKNYTLAGAANFITATQTAGDVAALIRYSTPDRSSKNHPVYCFNYYHAMCALAGSTGGDSLNAAQRTALQTYAANWISGFSDGVTTFHRSRPTGDLCTGYVVPAMFTHRDLPH